MRRSNAVRILRTIFTLGIPLVRAAVARRRAKPGDEAAANRELIDTTLETARKAREQARR